MGQFEGGNTLKKKKKGSDEDRTGETDTVRRQLTAVCCTTLEFKRLSKHYASESHNNDQRINKRHKVRETESEGERKKEKKQ